MSVQQSWPRSVVVQAPEMSSVRDLGDNMIEVSAEVGATRIDGLSMLFDPDWYRARYPEAVDRRNPVEHYIQIGWELGFDPNPFFSTQDYLAANPDVAGAQINPFLHYVLYGARQGRRPRADG